MPSSIDHTPDLAVADAAAALRHAADILERVSTIYDEPGTPVSPGLREQIRLLHGEPIVAVIAGVNGARQLLVALHNTLDCYETADACADDLV